MTSLGFRIKVCALGGHFWWHYKHLHGWSGNLQEDPSSRELKWQLISNIFALNNMRKSSHIFFISSPSTPPHKMSHVSCLTFLIPACVNLPLGRGWRSRAHISSVQLEPSPTCEITSAIITAWTWVTRSLISTSISCWYTHTHLL